jgi:hypothetical protein
MSVPRVAAPTNVKCLKMRPRLSFPAQSIISESVDLSAVADEIVVFFVSPYPEPHDRILITTRKSAIVISDSSGPNIADRRFELH